MVKIRVPGRGERGGTGKLVPSRYQKAIFDWVKEGEGNAVVEAVAGSGKTSSALEALSNMKGSVLFCAFNRHIKDELARRAPPSVNVSTIHSMGLKTVTRALGRVVVDGDKLRNIVDDLLEDEYSPGYVLHSSVTALARMAKLTLANASDDKAMAEMADMYDLIEPGVDESEAIGWARDVLRECEKNTGVVDYDDMVWLPAKLGFVPEQFDWVVVDEVQDLNAAQRALVLSAVRRRVLAIGDSKQGIYGFAGADLVSMDRFRDELSAASLPLSICYRCPTSHLDMARELVPQIEARENAPAGTVLKLSLNEATEMLRDDDLFICRVNAPLASAAMSLLRQGRKVTILGRDISRGLLRLIDRMKGGSLEDLLAKLQEYRIREVLKLMVAKRTARAQALIDRVETVLALSDGASSVQELKGRVQSIFDDNPSRGVTFGSIHKVKGLEAQRVFLYRPDLLPFPKATLPWEREQEMNLKYVALTRAKDTLAFVSGEPEQDEEIYMSKSR